MRDHQCHHCGIFSKYEEMDSYTRFGCSSYNPPEPHDPVFICKKCSHKLKEDFADSFKKGYYRTGDWQKSKAEIEAAKEAGLVWIHNNESLEWEGRSLAFEYIPKNIYEQINELGKL